MDKSWHAPARDQTHGSDYAQKASKARKRVERTAFACQEYTEIAEAMFRRRKHHARLNRGIEKPGFKPACGGPGRNGVKRLGV
jgi:hypothetical protein